MITVVYASAATRAMDGPGLTELLHTARSRNAAAHVTGMLIYAYESFMQQLEGDAPDVDAIFAAIVQDERHTDVRLLTRHERSERRYADWSMGFAHSGAEIPGVDLPAYRDSAHYPLVDSRLVVDPDTAETMLEYAAASGPSGD